MFARFMQFSCENGTICLRVSRHECLKGFSAYFATTKTSYEFVNKWQEMTFMTPLSTERAFVPSSLDASSESIGHANLTPQRPLPGVGATVATGVLLYDQPSPAKKQKFIKDTMDEAIERAKLGRVHDAYI